MQNINKTPILSWARRFGAKLSTALLLGFAGAAACAAPLNVTLLGTGSPIPTSNRFSQSTLIEAGKQKLLFDVGRGVVTRISQLGIPLRDIDATFISHFHSDHIVGLPDLWLTSRLPTGFGSRKQPMAVYGPEGTVAMTDNLVKAYSRDIEIREADELIPPSSNKFDAHDITPGVVYEKDGVKVTAFETHHGDLITPNYGYIIEYDGKKVLITSDTTYDERIAQQGKGADMIIHEVAAIDPGLLKEYPRFKEINAHHTTPEEAGRIFTMAAPRLAAYTHIIIIKPDQPLEQPTDEVVTRTRATYKGPLVVGEDLMRFEIDKDIKVFDANKKPVAIDMG